METIAEIKLKIAEHEAKIDDLLADNIDIFVKIDLVDSYLIGRKALVWALSNDQLLTR